MASLSKNFFGLPEVSWRGHTVNQHGVRLDPGKISVVAEWPRPRNVKELHSFLGFANVFRQYMQGYSQQIAELTKLTRKNYPYIWAE